MSEKTPASQSAVLRSLYQVREALQRDAYDEGIRHVGDCAARILNERDWCYDTDATLAAMGAFVLQLGDSIGALIELHEQPQQELKTELIQIINSTLDGVTQASNGQSHWANPDDHLDFLEREQKARKYGGTT